MAPAELPDISKQSKHTWSLSNTELVTGKKVMEFPMVGNAWISDLYWSRKTKPWPNSHKLVAML